MHLRVLVAVRLFMTFQNKNGKERFHAPYFLAANVVSNCVMQESLKSQYFYILGYPEHVKTII